MNSKRRELYVFFFAVIPLGLFLFLVRHWSESNEPTITVPGLPTVHIPIPYWLTQKIPNPESLLPIAFSSPQAKAIAIGVVILAAAAIIVLAFLIMDLIGKFLNVPMSDEEADRRAIIEGPVGNRR